MTAHIRRGYLIVASASKTSRVNPSQLIAQLKRKRFVFSVCTGRCGTGFLSKMLGYLSGVTAKHEPAPCFSNVMRRAQSDPEAAREFVLYEKAPRIAECRGDVYIETSHLVCKGFIEQFLELGLLPDLLVIDRPHREVATSLLQLQTIPGRTDLGRRYLLHPNDPNVLQVAGPEELNDYQLCYWYCLEMQRRKGEYAETLARKGARVARINLDEVTSLSGIDRLTDALALPRIRAWKRRRLLRRLNVGINDKTGRKRALPELDYEALEQDVCDRIAQCR